MANSNISKDSFFNIGGNPNLDAADTGVDPSTGRILTKKERKEIFKKRKISASGVFGRKSGSEALVKRNQIVPIVTGLLSGGVAEKLMKDKGDDELKSDSESKILKGLMIRVNNNSKKITLLKNIIKLNIDKVSKLFNEQVTTVSKQQAEDLKDQRLEEEEEQRKKKEGFLEKVGKSFKSTLLSPVEKVGKGVKGILERLGDAFMALFMGFVANKGIKMFQALMEGDTETFKKMRNMLIGSVAVIGGIFLALNVGLAALPAIIGGLASAVVSIGGAMMAFMASPAGLIALGLAAGIGVLFALKKGVDAGRDYATGGAAFTEKHDALDQRLIDAGMTVKGEVLTGNAQQKRAGKGPKGKRSAEQEKIFQEVQEQRKVLNDTHTKMDAEVKQAQENAEPDSYIMRRVGKKRVRVPVVSQKRKDEIKEEIESKYYDRLRGVTTSPNIDSSPKNKDVKIDSNPKKNGVTTLEEPKVEIIDVSANKKKKRNQNQKAVATIVPNISAFDPDNSSIFYTEMQFNIG